MTQAKIKTTNVFNRAYRSTNRITCLQGGTRSSKTYSLCQLFIIKALQETGKTFTIVRKTLPACKGSVYRDFLNIVKELEMYSEEYHNKSELSFTLNGNLIEFISVDFGPERGVNQEDTIIEVNDYLIENNFSLIKFEVNRITGLYKNMSNGS